MDAADTLSEVTQALYKLESFDADLRYMGLSDLKTLFEGPQRLALVTDHYRVLQQVKDEVVKHLADPITEVQTQAVKTLGPMVRLLPDHEVMSVLGAIAAQKASIVLTLALRTVIGNCEASSPIARVLVGLVLERDSDPSYQTTIEDCEVVSDLVRRFGPYLLPEDIDRLLRHIMDRVGRRPQATGNLVRRRSFEALGLLVPYETEEQWARQREFIAATLESGDVNGVQLVTALCTLAPNRVGTIPHVPDQLLSLSQSIEEDESNIELVERSLAAVEALYLANLVSAAQVCDLVPIYLQYNPNYVDDANDSDDAGSEFELSDDDDVGYDDDVSWKLRRYAVRLVAEIAQNDPAAAVPLVKPLVELLRVESEQGVREQAVDVLSALTAIPPLLAELLPYAGLFIEQAQKETVYIPLLTTLVAAQTLTPAQIEQVIGVATAQTKRATLPATLSLVQALAAQMDTADARLAVPVAAGLSDVEFQTVTLALDAALALGSPDLADAVCSVVQKTRNLSIQGQALKVAAAIVDDARAGQVLQHELTALDTFDLQVPAMHALQELMERCELSDAAASEAAARLTQLLAASKLRAVVIAALRALRWVAKRVPQQADAIVAAAQLHAIWEVAVVLYKCELFAEIAHADGVSQFALEAGQRVGEHPGVDDNVQQAIVKLWGAVAEAGNAEAVLAEAERAAEASHRAAFWALVIAEVAVRAHLPLDTEFSEFGVRLVAALAARGRCVTSLAALAKAAGPGPTGGDAVSPLVAGPALAEVALANDELAELYAAAAAAAQDSAAAEMYMAALEIVLHRRPAEEIVATARSLIELVPLTDLQIVGRLLGHAIVALPAHAALLEGWPVLCQVLGAKHAFKTAPVELQKQLEVGLLGYAEHGDLVVRETALEALSWALQQTKGPTVGLGEVLAVVLRASYVDKSLLETIQVGPFKHTVDHGLGARKAAYEAVYALVSHRGVDVVRGHGAGLMDALVRGLRDEHDVRMLSLYTLETLAGVPAAGRLLAEARPALGEAFSEIEAVKVRETSVKQEHDRQAEALQALAAARRAVF